MSTTTSGLPGTDHPTRATLELLLAGPVQPAYVARQTGLGLWAAIRELDAFVERSFAEGPDDQGRYRISTLGRMLGSALDGR